MVDLPEKQVPTPSPVARPVLISLGEKAVYGYFPQADITTFELAEIVGFMPAVVLAGIGAASRKALDDLFAKMTPGAQRHWQVNDIGRVVLAHGAMPKGLTFPKPNGSR